MQVRRMLPEDCETVGLLEKENFSMPWSAKAFLDELNRSSSCYLVAAAEREIFGYCGFVFAADEGEITNVCVAGYARRQGIARQMMTVLLDEARGRGVKKLFLEVRESNEAAKALYASLGFQAAGRRRRFYELPKEDAVLMSCTL